MTHWGEIEEGVPPRKSEGTPRKEREGQGRLGGRRTTDDGGRDASPLWCSRMTRPFGETKNGRRRKRHSRPNGKTLRGDRFICLRPLERLERALEGAWACAGLLARGRRRGGIRSPRGSTAHQKRATPKGTPSQESSRCELRTRGKLPVFATTEC